MLKILYIDQDDIPDVNDSTNVIDYFEKFQLTKIENKINRKILDLFEFVVENDFI